MKKMQNIINTLGKIWTYQFWPMHLLKDCSKGNHIERYMAYKYNQTKIYLLQLPILNWIIVAIASYSGLVISELCCDRFNSMQASTYMPAIFGVSFAISLIPPLILSICYTFLKNIDIELMNNKD